MTTKVIMGESPDRILEFAEDEIVVDSC